MQPARLCEIDGCGRAHYARGWCARHYLRWLRNGDPVKIPPRKTADPYERVMRRARGLDPSKCWPWPGKRRRAKDGFDYGVIRLAGSRREESVARVIVARKLGRRLQPGEVARHSCDLPPCFNPDHLLAGTQADNIADMMARGRHRTQRNLPQDS